MKPNEFKSALSAVSKSLIAAGAFDTAQALASIAEMLGESPKNSIASTVKLFANLAIDSHFQAHGMRAVDLARFLREFEVFTVSIGKAQFNRDLELLIDLLTKHSQQPVAALVYSCSQALVAPPAAIGPTPVEPDAAVVRKYVKLLEESLGDDGFEAVYKSLDQDALVGKNEAIDIAKQFAGKATRSRPAALKATRKRHDTVMSFRAKSESRAGRSAA